MKKRPFDDRKTSRMDTGAPVREVFLQRPQKRAEIRRLMQEFLSQATNMVVGVGILLALYLLKYRYLPAIDNFWVLIVTVAAVGYLIWLIEGRRTKKRQQNLIAAADKAAGEILHDFTFNDGSKGSFTPGAVLHTANGLIIAIDTKRLLVRMIRTGNYPGQGHDWIYELPSNMDVDVADRPSRRSKGKPVPSLVFSSEEEDGFKITAFALAQESVTRAKEIVAELQAAQHG